jgi:hypothetical protein
MFLAENNIGEEYIMTQKQMKAVMDVAKRLGREEEIYVLLSERVIGLAQADSIGGGTVIA